MSMYIQLPDNMRGMVNLPHYFRCQHTTHAILTHFAVAVQPSTAIVHIEPHISYAYENELVHKMLGKLGSGVKYVATYVCVHDLLSLMVCVYMHVLD